jgi:hypothetical protein
MCDRILAALQLTLDEQYELDARRSAERLRLFLAVVEIPNAERFSDTSEVHLLEPGTWQCLTVRRTWEQMSEVLMHLTPIGLRKLQERARPCAAHADAAADLTHGGDHERRTG